MDMEAAHSLLGDSSFFVGDPPRSFEDFLNKFCLQTGVAVVALADDKQQHHGGGGGVTRTMVARAGPRLFKENGGLPVSRIFAERSVRSWGQLSWTPQQIDDILAHSDRVVERGVEGKAPTPSRAALKSEQLIKSLVMALHAETIEMSFPYRTLHRQSWRFLGFVRRACDPVLRALYTPAYLKQEACLPFVVGYVFMAARETPVADLRPLHYAAQTFNAWVSTGDPGASLEVLEKMGAQCRDPHSHEDFGR
jgi:hypothetical protein